MDVFPSWNLVPCKLRTLVTQDLVLLASLYALVNSLEAGRENLQSVLLLCRVLHLPNQTPQLQVLPMVRHVASSLLFFHEC